MSADPTSPWATKAPMILSSTRANTSLSPNQCQNVAASDFTLQSWPPSFPPPYSAQIDANRCATHRLDTDQAEALPLSVTREHAELEDERNPDLTTVGAAGFPGQQISSCVSSPNKQDWNSHRSVIAQLYLDLNLPLKDVKKVMEDRHNFIASFRAYKHRFRTWEWFKYKASHVPGDGRQQMPACIRSSQRRGQVLADLGGGSQTTALVSLSAAVGVAGVPGLSSSSTPLFTIPVDDELSRHKAHAIQTMRNLLRYMSENHSYHHVQRFAKVTYYFKEGLQHFAHRPETGSLYLTRAFRWLDHGMRRSPPQTISFIVCCLPCQVLRTFSSSPSLANATLGAFFDYVARFLAIRGANPMSTTIASIMHVLQKAPEQLSDLVSTLLLIWEELCDELLPNTLSQDMFDIYTEIVLSKGSASVERVSRYLDYTERQMQIASDDVATVLACSYFSVQAYTGVYRPGFDADVENTACKLLQQNLGSATAYESGLSFHFRDFIMILMQRRWNARWHGESHWVHSVRYFMMTILGTLGENWSAYCACLTQVLQVLHLSEEADKWDGIRWEVESGQIDQSLVDRIEDLWKETWSKIDRQPELSVVVHDGPLIHLVRQMKPTVKDEGYWRELTEEDREECELLDKVPGTRSLNMAAS